MGTTGFNRFTIWLRPRITSLSWVAWLAFILLELGWEAQVVDWSLLQISPFSYVHYTIDITNLPLFSLVCLVCISVLMTGIGLLGFRNRDILTKA